MQTSLDTATEQKQEAEARNEEMSYELQTLEIKLEEMQKGDK
eukprot:CAMPEP_0201282046 /NCGR_PEP_ID=MMETSP1317-20130820/4708_1 /ASSEMBLY_ACC=CAM_ASM_000770 /TAXON_ID=187299 /ORGANISM="Undescribed Undescribed, Strain Undescribed" /LENGTH=41 /DNA_ID= /DNA_START= /DNA_END= /DNA_ORIENTATION=